MYASRHLWIASISGCAPVDSTRKHVLEPILSLLSSGSLYSIIRFHGRTPSHVMAEASLGSNGSLWPRGANDHPSFASRWDN